MPLSAKAGCRVRACSSLSAGGGLGGEPSPETIFQLPTEEEFLCACRRFRPAGEWTTFSIGVNNGSAQTDGSHGPRWRSYSPGYHAPGLHPHAHRRPMLPICHGPRACAGDQTTARRQPCIRSFKPRGLWIWYRWWGSNPRLAVSRPCAIHGIEPANLSRPRGALYQTELHPDGVVSRWRGPKRPYRGDVHRAVRWYGAGHQMTVRRTAFPASHWPLWVHSRALTGKLVARAGFEPATVPL